MDNSAPGGGKRTGSQPDSPDDHRSRQDSGHLSCSFPQTVKEAVAIAAGKKGASSKEDDRRKNFRSNMLCYLYWLLVILILGLISFTVWLSIQLARRHSDAMISQNGRYGEKQPFTFEDIFNSTFRPKTFDVQWLKDRNGYVYRSTDGSVYYFDIVKNASEKLVDKTVFDLSKADSFSVSPDLKYVLLRHDVKKKWRHSFTAKYSIYWSSGGSNLLDFPNYDAELKGRLAGKPLQYASWAPTTSALVFVLGNNIYYQSGPDSSARQLTFTGDEKFIFNGATDWLYEEEILRSHVTIWWSPDSRHISYASINDTLVPLFRFPDYGSKNLLTGNFIEFAYPKAGDLSSGENPRLKMFVVDTKNIDNQNHLELPAPSEIINKDHYVVQVAWRDNSHVTVVWSNRAQNKTVTTIYNVITKSSFNNLYRTAVDGWLEALPPVKFIEDGSEYLTIMAQSVKETGTWNHVALVTAKDNEEGKVSFLTHGLQEIQSIVGYDDVKHLVYYLSTNGDSKKRHLLRVGTSLADPSLRTPLCVSCKLGPGCQYVDASFSSNGRYFVLGCLGPDVPTYRLMEANRSLDVMLEDNVELSKALSTKILPDREHYDVPIGGGLRGVAEVLAPPGANSDEKTKKYPLLVYAHNEPGTQQVTEKFRLGWETYLVTSEEVAVAYLDGRGSTSRGNKFKHEVYRNLGVVDVEDQLLGGLFFKTLDYIDPAKAAIWGWSFGGFVTSHSVANDKDIFPCGISGAALPDGKSYATAMFERFMGYANSDDNENGYEKTDVTKKIDFLQNKKFMLVHGTADDNIPFASSVPLITLLTEKDIQFRFQFYTDLDRHFVGYNRHLYRLMTDFLKNECFSYFWKHETQTWIVDKSQKKDKFRIKQFCV